MIELDKSDINWINKEIRDKGHIKVLDDLLHSLNVTRYLPDGIRITATTYYTYKVDLLYYDYVINDGIDNGLLTDEQCQKYRNKLDERIAANTEYEKIDIPIDPYKNANNGKRKTKISTKKTRTARTTNVFTGEVTTIQLDDKGGIIDKPKKKTPAERRLEILNKKAIKINFNLK